MAVPASAATVISTHSLTRRLTVVSPSEESKNEYFNSQPHKEADHFTTFRKTWLIYFNSQPHKEADTSSFGSPLKFCLFQLTASQGG